MPVTVNHALNATTPDDPAYEIRPSHWNSAHNITFAPTGAEIIGAFSNENNVSFSTNGAGYVVASANVTAAASPVNVTAGTTSGNLQTIAFSNSNGVSFGLNGSTITASHNGLTTAALSNHSHGNPTLNLTNLSGTTNSNSAGFTLSLSAAAQSVQPVAASAANGSYAFSTLSFSNANGVSFGTSAGSAITASHNGLTTARASNDAVGLNTAQSNVTWTVNSSGLSLDARGYAGTGTSATNASITLNSNGLAISVAAPGGAASATLYATGNTTVNSSGTVALSSLLMRGYGIVSLGTSNGSVLVSSPDPVTLAPSWYAVGNTTGASSSTTLAPDTISIQGTGGVSVGYSNGSIVISGNTGGGGGVTTGGFYALGNTTQNSSTTLALSAHSFNGLGAMTVGYSNGSIQLSAPATSSLSATGNASISVNGSTISLGANAAAVSLSGNSTSAGAGYSHVSSGTLYLAGGNNITLSQNGASVTISGANAGGAQTGISGIEVSNTTYTSGTVTWRNANGISFGSSGANGISASYTVPDVANFISRVNVSAGTTSNNLTAVTFADGNGVSFGLNGSVVTGSHNGLTTARASNDAIGLNTAQTNVTWTVNSSGLSLNAAGYAGTGTSITGAAAITLNSNGLQFNGASLAGTSTGFAGANISGSITHNTAGINLSLSVAAPGAAAENNWVHLLGANTAGNTTASGSTIGYSGINLTLSGTNGSIVNISAPATSSLSATGMVSLSTNGSTISIGAPPLTTLSAYLEAAIDREWMTGQIGQNQLFVQPMPLRAPVQFDEICWPGTYIATSNQSGSFTVTMNVGFYSRNASTLSLITSTSSSWAATNSGTVGSYSIYSGVREFGIPFTTTFNPGNYFIAFLSRTTTGGAAGMSMSQYVASNVNSPYVGRWSSAANATNQFVMGMGSFNTTTTALPNSFGLSAINGSAAVNLRPIIYKLVSQDLN